MARIRSVKPELRTSLTVAEWPRDVRYLWVLLWGYLDDHGRGVDDARLVKADCFPLDEDLTSAVVDEWLSTIADAGPLCRYEVDGRRFMHCPNWTEHQRPSHPADSKIPPCPHHETGSKPPKTIKAKAQAKPLAKSSGDSREVLVPEQGDVSSKGKSEKGPLRGGTLARVAPEPPDSGDEPGPAERILTTWIDTLRTRPMSRIVNQIGDTVRTALAEGIPERSIAEALRRWQGKGNLGPNALVALIHEVTNAPSNVIALPAGRGGVIDSPHDQKFAGWNQIANDLEGVRP